MISEIIFQWYAIDFFILFFNPILNFQWLFVEISTNDKLSFSGYLFEKNFNKYSLKFQKKGINISIQYNNMKSFNSSEM